MPVFDARVVQPITAIQSEYSLFWRAPEVELLPAMDELGIGFVPLNPLGAVFLAGKIDAHTTFDPTDFRNAMSRFSPEARKANMVLVEIVKAVAERKRAMLLAWLQRGYEDAPPSDPTQLFAAASSVDAPPQSRSRRRKL
ncbi:aldo/keto reductase [Sphingosinicella xenopeptidilytica]|uniref:Aldo/keto reductase n=1 Tax=Sphingosinicella xenopeptidilytica TaxID=364098 RepID=A0ABW3C790_SPHXN